jgi:hypothetical protein
VKSALEQDREQQMLDWIKQSAEGSTPVPRKEIKDSDPRQFRVPITRGWVNSFFLRSRMTLFTQKVSAKKSSVCKYRECPSNEHCRISMNMNMFRAVQMNSSSIWMKLAFQTGKIARQEKL